MISITKGIKRIDVSKYSTWIFLERDNDFVPEFRGRYGCFNMIYSYEKTKTYIAQHME